MLKSLRLKNFTSFSDSRFEFGKGLNVIVGENGLGKTHILKAAYALSAASARGMKEPGLEKPTKIFLQSAIAKKLVGVFRPDSLGRLARRKVGKSGCDIELTFADPKQSLACYFTTSSTDLVKITKTPEAWVSKVPVFLPTRELLTLGVPFVSIYETTQLPFEETWRDTCLLLGAPLAKGAREQSIKALMEPLEEAMEGKVVSDSQGRFFLKTPSGEMEMYLVAEGLRKLAMIARLIATGVLLDKGALFWDEPEANLNPKIIRNIARTILSLSQNGIQVFIATHSLFLMRELQLLQQSEFQGIDARCFGLHRQGQEVVVTQGKTMDDIGDITALDQDLEQSERYLDAESAAGAQ